MVWGQMFFLKCHELAKGDVPKRQFSACFCTACGVGIGESFSRASIYLEPSDVARMSDGFLCSFVPAEVLLQRLLLPLKSPQTQSSLYLIFWA